jgi:TPR repeat protein
LYNNGQGVDQSYERAVEYYEAAARQGLASAQFNLGSRYALGQGVEKSFEKAREWWIKSAEQGHEGAINGLQLLDKAEGRTTPSFIPNPIECAFCYRPHDPPEHRLKPCNRCHRVYYCGEECQVKHWERQRNGHKKLCQGLCTPESEKAREARGAQEAKKGGGGEEPKTTTPTTGTHVTFRF